MPSTLSLAEAFSRRLSPEVPASSDTPSLTDALTKFVAAARAAWPDLEVDEVLFIEHLAERMQVDTALEAIHAADLYLAFACLLGEPGALEEFDRSFLSKVSTALGQLPTGLTVDDVLQTLRLKLFVRNGELAPKISAYSGRGALIHWVRAAGVRVVQDFARTRKLEVSLSDDAFAAVGEDAELAYLKTRFAPEFKTAFHEALAALSPRDQSLLRLQFVDGINPDEIGRIYKVHRTTVWRWLTQCREELFKNTRRLFAARVPMNEREFTSLMNAVRSQLDVSINRVLRKSD
jgi:RNA polymerase sigma-70 factor (ECF subfamily)